MKSILTIAMFIIPFLCYTQSDYKQINKYLALKKTKNGYVFTDNKGKQSREYTNVNLKNYGFIEMSISYPRSLNEIKSPQPISVDTTRFEKCGTPLNDIYTKLDIHVFQLMKELQIIDDFEFYPFSEFTWADIRDGKINDIGYVLKEGKYALVSTHGEFLSEFKYNHSTYFDDNKPVINNYTENGKLITVVLDHLTGLEWLATSDSLVRYWSPENYLVKTNEHKYFLTYKAKTVEVPEIWKYVEYLSYESSLFTYKNLYSKNRLTVEERGFITFSGEKIEPKGEIIPYTNFYNGHCLVTEVVEEEKRLDNQGNVLPQKKLKVLKIINENFETIKVLDEVSYIRSSFNKYGQIVVENKYETDNNFVIDYTGKHIIPPSGFANRIKEVYAGIYRITDRAYPSSDESRKQENFYNQKGEKLLNKRTLETTWDIKFKEGIQENYLIYNNFKFVTLDKSNRIINSYFE